MKTDEKRPGIHLERIKAALTNHKNHPEETGDSIKALREQCFLNFQAILNTHYGTTDRFYRKRLFDLTSKKNSKVVVDELWIKEGNELRQVY